MKESLAHLTVSEFIELMEGNLNVLLCTDEKAEPEKLESAVLKIIFEYREITDAPGMKSYFLKYSRQYGAKLSVLLYSICDSLIRLKEYGQVKKILGSRGVNTDNMPEARLEAEVAGRLAKANNTLKKLADENVDSEHVPNIRKEFDAQTAALMAHFKFQIDTEKMRASVYAQLVARLNKEIKAQLSALNKRL